MARTDGRNAKKLDKFEHQNSIGHNGKGFSKYPLGNFDANSGESLTRQLSCWAITFILREVQRISPEDVMKKLREKEFRCKRLVIFVSLTFNPKNWRKGRNNIANLSLIILDTNLTLTFIDFQHAAHMA